MRPRLLDLYCCQGGAAAGYVAAGFDVVGVDMTAQPRYPYEFHQGDALAYLAEHGGEFDAIHASPPCQAYTAQRVAWRGTPWTHPELVERHPGRVDRDRAAVDHGKTYPAHRCRYMAVMLCGSHVRSGRGRATSCADTGCSNTIPTSRCGPYSCQHSRNTVGIYGDHLRRRGGRAPNFPNADRVRLASQALGVDWMDWHGLTLKR